MSDNGQSNDDKTLFGGDSTGFSGRDFKKDDVIGGRYRIKSIIGRGGMGVVYRAEHIAMRRECAIKMLAPDLVTQSNWQRFQAEARAIAQLDQVNIVKVYDMGVDGPECLYYVMDLLQGMSLAEILKQRRYLSQADSLDIFLQLANGLAYAHKRNIIHRDIKPSNLILCPVEGSENRFTVKIIDFGLVKLIGDSDQPAQSLTATGVICGSPLYMSPEQFVGAKIDQRSDIYSFGCALFECLTGMPPFRGSNALQTSFMHQNDEPPALNDLRPSGKFPDNLEHLVSHLLRKSPSDRYQSMDQVVSDLKRVIEGQVVKRTADVRDEPLFQIDDEKETSLEEAKSPIKLWLSLAAAVLVFGGMAAAAFTWYANTKNYNYNPLVPKRMLSKDQTDVGAIYDNWPQISNGVTEQSGSQVRRFNFPDPPVGFIVRNHGEPVLARGVIDEPANAFLTLSLPRPEGYYARLFPQILSKIGPDDINELLIEEPQNPMDESVLSDDIKPEVIQAISKWKAIKSLNFYHCTLSRPTILCLNSLPPVEVLKLRDATSDGADLAEVKWISACEFIDVKNCKHVDEVLKAVAHSKALKSIDLDATFPTATGLKNLETCPNLKMLRMADTDIDDQKLEVVAQLQGLDFLSLKNCVLSLNGLRKLAPLKNLRTFEGTEMTGFRAALRKMFPDCQLNLNKPPDYGNYRVKVE